MNAMPEQLNLFHPDITCTDPDQLQFCLKLSDTEYWYCEPNCYNDLLLPDSNDNVMKLLRKYKGNPSELIEDAGKKEDVKAFINNLRIWLTGIVDIADFDHDEMVQLLDDYGYTWNDFESDVDRNQIICENYFEQNPLDFRNDI
jgi:hypothetical protein